MKIAAIIIGIDGWEQYTLPLIESIQSHEPDVDVHVVDNASDPSYLFAHRTDQRLCYSAAINFGKEMAGDADWYIVLSNDVLCTGPFAHLLAAQDGKAVIGPQLKSAHGFDYLEGWAVFVPQAAWQPWDERFLGSDYEDVAYSTAARQRGFYLEQVDLPFVHLDQRQRFSIVEDFAGKNAHNRELFLREYANKPLGSAPTGSTVKDVFTPDTCTLYTVKVGGIEFCISDLTSSMTVPFVLRELAMNQYGLNGRTFKDGDVILDIGANVGVVSIYLAKQLPNVTIYAYEPAMLNYERLCANLSMNGITNVVPINKAVSANGRTLKLHYNPDNLGGASAFMGRPPWQYEEPVESVTLQSILDTHGIERVALLKMDIEGAEHEVLASCNGLLERVDYLTMEAHFSPKLRAAGHTPEQLQRVLRPLINRGAVQVAMLEAAA